MEAVVLAGGLGSRLRTVVSDLPKPMVPVAGRPFLEIVLLSLAKKGFERVVLSLGYLAESIVSHFGDSFAGMKLLYEIETSPLGTGGAVRSALMRCTKDHVFVFNGDTFLDLEITQVQSLWSSHHSPIVIAQEMDDTARYGRLDVDEGLLKRFMEKGVHGKGLINAGCYVLPRNILDTYKLGKAFSLEADFLSHAIMRQDFYVFVSHGYFIDIGIPEDYHRAQIELADITL